MNEDESDRLLDFFKALADKSRLKIVGFLAQRDATTEDLAEILNLTPGTVSHHLARLSKAGLVTARARGYYNIYQLEISSVENMAKVLLGNQLGQLLPEEELEGFDKKVLRDFTTKTGKFKSIPAQRKKRAVLLHHLKNSFKPGVQYTEKQVNEIVKRFHDDTATLRRELIAEKLLMRDGGVYWKKE
jgi:hypothetical protein